MRIRFILFCVVSFLLSSYNSNAQVFGGTPPAQKWQQINTDTARIIFPIGMDSTAKRIASIVHKLAIDDPVSLGTSQRKINIVLQHNTTVGNGYVGLGPFRSEFYLTPVINNFHEGSIAWADQLALHEYRHVQQFNNFRNGLSKTMYYLFGEEGLALAINASVPDWFYEGDAVYNETIRSRQGRGRLPLFLNAYPALWRAGKNYSWMKLRNGSLKDYVPSHYHLGYLLVNYGYEKYGTDFWQKVTRDASAFKGLFYPFQHAIRQHAGVSYETFRKDAYDHYRKMAMNILDSTTKKPHSTAAITSLNTQYVNDRIFPYHLGSDSLLYLRSTFRHRPAFMIKDSKGEHRLRSRDISIDDQFSYRNGRIVYAAYSPDPRWGWRDYSDIRVLNVSTGRQLKLTRRSKYFTPDISTDGQRVVAVHLPPSGKNELHVLDGTNGAILQVIRSSDIQFFSDPKFYTNDSIVMAVRLRDGKMALALADIPTGNTMRLTLPSYNVVGYPSINGNLIYFTASYGGNDDVFALRMPDKKIFRITNGPLGNYFVNASGGKITWSAFTAEGYQLKQVEENELSWEEMSEPAITQVLPLFDVRVPANAGDLLQSDSISREFPITAYKKSTKLFNFHSWRPYYEDPIFTYSIYGENILNTLQTEIYYLYHQDEKTSAVGLNAVYGQLFPYVHAGTEFTFDRRGLMSNRVRRWNQLDTRLGLSLPLNFTNGRSYKSLNASSFYVLRNEFNRDFFKDSLGNTTFSYLSHGLSWTQQVQRAVQHLFPRWGYSLRGSHRHAISSYEGYQFFGNASLFLPGIASVHHLVISGGFQQRDTLRALFSNSLASARGYADYYRTGAGSRMWRISGNYHFPLLIPDWGFGNILYLHRLRANVFYDVQRLFSNDKINSADLRSTGAEFYVDTKWWNQYALTFGFRISHLLDDDPLAGRAKGSNVFEFILPVSIIPR